MKKYLLALCLCAAFGAQAQITDTTDLETVVISANRFAENKKFVAQQVNAISAKKIARYSQPTTAELLTQTGLLTVQKSQLGGGSPVLRGFEANKILITVDGVRMNNAIFRGGHLQNVITMDNAVLERVEILQGTSAVIYGSDALGGVLNFYTKKPLLSDTDTTKINGNAFVRYSTAYKEKTAHADVSVGGRQFGSLTSFTITDFGDLKQGKNNRGNYPLWGLRTFYVERINNKDSIINNPNVHEQVQTGYTQYDVLQKFLLARGKFKHTLNFQFSTSSNIFRYDRLTETTAAGLPRSAQWYYGPQQRLMSSYQIELPANRIFDNAQIIAAYQNIKESRHNRNFNSARLNHRNETVDVATLNADFRKKMNAFELSYGTEVTYNYVKSTAYSENIITGQQAALDTRYPDGGSNTQSLAVYASSIYKLSEKLVLNSGLRFTHSRLNSRFIDKSFFPFPYNELEQKNTGLNGNIGIIALPGNNLKLSGIFSTGFRTPNVDDLAKVFESGGGRVILPNPDIKPENTYSFEVGVEKRWSNVISATVHGWYTLYNDVLTTDFSTFNGMDSISFNGNNARVLTVVNKDAAYLLGGNAIVEARLASHFALSTAYTYTYGRIKEAPKNYPLDHIQPAYGKTSVLYEKPTWFAEFFTLYNAAKKTKDYNLRGEDNQVYSAEPVVGFTPAWVTLNVRGSYQFSKNIKLQVAVENITDRFYRTFASGLSAPGRNVSATVRVGF